MMAKGGSVGFRTIITRFVRGRPSRTAPAKSDAEVPAGCSTPSIGCDQLSAFPGVPVIALGEVLALRPQPTFAQGGQQSPGWQSLISCAAWETRECRLLILYATWETRERRLLISCAASETWECRLLISCATWETRECRLLIPCATWETRECRLLIPCATWETRKCRLLIPCATWETRERRLLISCATWESPAPWPEMRCGLLETTPPGKKSSPDTAEQARPGARFPGLPTEARVWHTPIHAQAQSLPRHRVRSRSEEPGPHLRAAG